MTPAPEAINVPVRATLTFDGVSPEIATELSAMSSCAGILAMLDEPARHRSIAWLVDFYMVPLGEPDYHEHEPDEAAQRAVVAAAAAWAAQMVDEMSPAEIESTILEAQGWGDEKGLIEGALPLISARLRKLAELAVAEGETPWPST